MLWILIAIFTSLLLFYYFTCKMRIRRKERREHRSEKHQQYLDALLEQSKEQREGSK